MSGYLKVLIAVLLPTAGCMIHAALNGERLAVQGGVLFYAAAVVLITLVTLLGIIPVIVLAVVAAAVAWLAVRLSEGGLRRERRIT